MKILDAGCGIQRFKGADYLDSADLPNLTYKHDLNKFPYPIKDKTYDLIYCSHTLEHLDNILRVLKEFKRILKEHGEIIIKVPYLTSQNAFQDPTHKHYFTYFTFDYYATNPSRHLELWYTPDLFRIKSKRLTFDKFGIRVYNYLVEWFANHYPIYYENLLKYLFPAKELKVELKNE